MTKRQTRRSISVKGITYQRLKGFCDDEGVSVSGLLEQLIATHLDARGVPQEHKLLRSYPNTSPAETPEEVAAEHFTF